MDSVLYYSLLAIAVGWPIAIFVRRGGTFARKGSTGVSSQKFKGDETGTFNSWLEEFDNNYDAALAAKRRKQRLREESLGVFWSILVVAVVVVGLLFFAHWLAGGIGVLIMLLWLLSNKR